MQWNIKVQLITTSLFQISITYKLKLTPAISEGCSRRAQEKKCNACNANIES